LLAREINVSKEKPVTASDYLGTFIPANAVDGNIGSRWVATDATYTEHWLEIDLQNTYTVERIVIDADDAIIISDFSVQAWVNGAWTNIVSVVDSRKGDYEFVDFTPVSTNKIRYIAKDVNYYPTTSILYNGVRLWEISVYSTYMGIMTGALVFNF
jgi:hypothetical protein